MTRLLFVGERQSPKAAAGGHTWENGRAAAHTLHEALRATGLDPTEHEYDNLWRTPGTGRITKDEDRDAELCAINRIHAARGRGLVVVGMGALVQGCLRRYGIPHLALVHPAARGRIRRRDRYQAHVAEVLMQEGSRSNA